MLFDLDNTLYTMGHLGKSKMLLGKKLGKQYLTQKTYFSERATSRLLSEYRVRYKKMAVVGVVEELGLDGAEFEDYVDSRADLEFVISADPELDKFCLQYWLRDQLWLETCIDGTRSTRSDQPTPRNPVHRLQWNAIYLDPKNETCADQEPPSIKSLYDLPAVIPNLFP